MAICLQCSEGGGEIDLESSKYDLKPQIGQFWYLEPLIFFFSTFLGGGGGRKSGSGGIQMWLLLFYFYTGGKMVEKWIWKLPDMSLSLKLPTLHIWLIFFYFSTFQPGVKLVEKMDLEASKNWFKAPNKLVKFDIWTLYFSNFLLLLFHPRLKW